MPTKLVLSTKHFAIYTALDNFCKRIKAGENVRDEVIEYLDDFDYSNLPDCIESRLAKISDHYFNPSGKTVNWSLNDLNSYSTIDS